MSEATATAPVHPVLDLARRGRARLDALAGPASVPLSAMDADALAEALVELTTMAHQLEAVRLRVLAQADRNGDVADPGDRTAADWVARHTRQTRAAARADLRLARALDTDHRVLAAGMSRGTVSPAQARVVQRSLDLLPTTGEFAVTPAQRASAEAHLVDLAAHHDPKALEILGRRIHAVIAPGDADAREGQLLEAEEARAARKVSLDLWDDHQGVTHGKFRIPKLHGHILRKALQAIMSPARPAAETDVSSVEPVETTTPHRDPRPVPVRRGEAFCELLERLRAADLPHTGGGDATIVVKIDHDQLLAALDTAGVAVLDTGARISAAEARRLACGHRLLPAVLDSASVVLDLGRSRRLHTKAQRLALTIQQGHCTAEHCDVPAAMCHAHHDHPWATGGHTDTTTGRLLCGPHHRQAHPAYRIEITPDNQVRFHHRE